MSPIRGTHRVTRCSKPIPVIKTDRILRSHKASTHVIPTPSNPTSHKQAPKRRRRRRAGADPWTPYRKHTKKVESRPRAPPPTHFTCRICADEQPVSSFLKWVSPSRNLRSNPGGKVQEIPRHCIAHLCRIPRKKESEPVCRTCIGRAMVAKMEMTGARTVSTGCLEPRCSTYWDVTFVLKFLPLDSLEAYNMAMLPVWKESVETHTCVAEACGSIGILDRFAPGYPQIHCSDCSLRQCATCRIPWHAGISCADHAAKHINDQMTTPEKETLKLMQTKDGKRCPNCYIVIEKDGGCDSMQCMGCKTYFNWQLAASAVLGTKPTVTPHGLYGAYVVCEVDAIKNNVAARVVDPGYAPFPMPEEDPYL